jgi:hypothetical protein
MLTRPSPLALALALSACAPVYAPLPPVRDTGPIDAAPCPECPDTGPIVMRRDAGQDAGPPSDANVDAFRSDGGSGPDAGVPLMVAIDGTLGEAVWGEPLVSSIPPNDPFAGDHLDALYYFRDANWLYIGFEGGLVAGDRVVFYVDTVPFEGVSLTGSGLFDTSGAVDETLSIPINGTADFQPEFGWGTAAMPNAVSAGSATIGWRQLAPAGSFALLGSGSRSACSAVGCETAVLLSAIGATPETTINFVVRLGRPGADAGWSNQTFPTTDSASPEYVGDFTIGVPVSSL